MKRTGLGLSLLYLAITNRKVITFDQSRQDGRIVLLVWLVLSIKYGFPAGDERNAPFAGEVYTVRIEFYGGVLFDATFAEGFKHTPGNHVINYLLVFG